MEAANEKSKPYYYLISLFFCITSKWNHFNEKYF
jgi:hypothetical protein